MPVLDPSVVSDWIDASTRVVALTGAGISAESGVPTFRGFLHGDVGNLFSGVGGACGQDLFGEFYGGAVFLDEFPDVLLADSRPLGDMKLGKTFRVQLEDFGDPVGGESCAAHTALRGGRNLKIRHTG